MAVRNVTVVKSENKAPHNIYERFAQILHKDQMIRRIKELEQQEELKEKVS